MFDWVLNTPLFIDGYYLHGLTSSMYICLFQNVSKIAICCIIVITSYNKAILYELNTFIKRKLKVNWRKKLKLLTDAALHKFF